MQKINVIAAAKMVKNVPVIAAKIATVITENAVKRKNLNFSRKNAIVETIVLKK